MSAPGTEWECSECQRLFTPAAYDYHVWRDFHDDTVYCRDPERSAMKSRIAPESGRIIWYLPAAEILRRARCRRVNGLT